MKNKKIIYLILFFFCTNLNAKNIFIEAKDIKLDKNNQITIFQNQVKIVTEDGYEIECDYAFYDKKNGQLELKKNIVGVDSKKNIIKTNYAKYNEITKIFTTNGPTEIKTAEEYLIEGEDVIFNDKLKNIISKKKALIIDKDSNEINLENFDYQINDGLFKSVGNIEITDKLNNSYQFSQIYINTKKKEIIGSDTKAYLNDEKFKVNSKNKPRVFANTVSITDQRSSFEKSIFTICDYRENDKCPPWSLQSSRMLHDNKKKTIYYDNAVLKIYDIPIFYFPKFAHPDPTVKRRSGFLPPSFSDTKNLGAGLSIPYFWAIDDDKNFTLNNKFYFTEHPLFLGEYHQVFKNSSFITDFGYSEGYKKTSAKKKSGSKSHIFSKFVKNLESKNGSKNTFTLSNQHISEDKYLKLYKVESNLLNYNSDTLKNSLEFTSEKDDMFFGFNASVYETLNTNNSDKYEYIYPEIDFNKNLISDSKFGTIDLESNYKVSTYNTNQYSNFLTNDFDWQSIQLSSKYGINNRLIGNLKNINYETRNLEFYKEEKTSELFGSLGYLSEVNLEKKNDINYHFLKPKFLVKYAPGSMRKELDGQKLDPISAFKLNRISNINNYETGLSGTIGFDYSIKEDKNEFFKLSMAQIFNKIENKKMASATSLDEKISDLVGSSNYKLNETFELNYNFALDQNYKEFNYNEIGAKMDFNPIKIKFDFIEESKHIGDQKYFKTKLNIINNEHSEFSFSTKRNLIKDSSEYYNLSYEYINDCLRAGLVYRREFYEDSELEAENSLMFKITLTPFGNIDSPSFNQ